jgi:hemoglobin/transferrin/lactoferrin receptor protein
LRLFASYTEGFRAPSLNQLYLDGVHFSLPHPVLGSGAAGPPTFISNVFLPNPALTPETTVTIEGGASLEFADLAVDGDLLRLKGSWYESRVDDLIDLRVDFAFSPTCFAAPVFQPCSAGTSTSANVARAAISGAELEATWDAPRWFLRAAYAHIDGENLATGEDLGVLTPDRLSLDLRLKLPQQRAAVGTRMQFAADFERRSLGSDGALSRSEQRDGYAVFDLYATWRPSFARGLRLDVAVENVADADYERVFAGVSEPGRNIKVSVSWQGAR